MTTLHPDWHTTNESDAEKHEASPQKESGAQQIPIGSVHVSRQPAAIMGILLVVAISFVFIQGVDNLRGQISNAAYVSISASGLEPATITVTHGQTITWTNEGTTPHILESNTLCSDTGFCLHTTTLYEGESDNFTITQDIPAGNYDYFSTTSDDISGTIIVSGTSGSDEVSYQSVDDLLVNSLADYSPFDPAYNDVNTVTQPLVANQFAGNTAAGIPAPPAPLPNNNAAAIPRNPYTVDSARAHPFDASGLPVASPTPNYNSGTENFLDGRGPLRQPDTGAGVWLVVTLSFIGLWWMTRSCFCRIKQ